LTSGLSIYELFDLYSVLAVIPSRLSQ